MGVPRWKSSWLDPALDYIEGRVSQMSWSHVETEACPRKQAENRFTSQRGRKLERSRGQCSCGACLTRCMDEASNEYFEEEIKAGVRHVFRQHQRSCILVRQASTRNFDSSCLLGSGTFGSV